jgi:hypothetical protein
MAEVAWLGRQGWRIRADGQGATGQLNAQLSDPARTREGLLDLVGLGGAVHGREAPELLPRSAASPMGMVLGLGSQAGDPSGPRPAGRWSACTQIVQPASLQGQCALPVG